LKNAASRNHDSSGGNCIIEVIQTRIGDFILDKEAIQSRDYCVATNAMLRADRAPSAALGISVRGSDAAQAPQLRWAKERLPGVTRKLTLVRVEWNLVSSARGAASGT
jgi:hypothetical protein